MHSFQFQKQSASITNTQTQLDRDKSRPGGLLRHSKTEDHNRTIPFTRVLYNKSVSGTSRYEVRIMHNVVGPGLTLSSTWPVVIFN